MKSKAPLALMEQLVMVLVFALAAALCLQVFVLSGRMARCNEARDRAVIAVQNAAETLKGCGGDLAESAALCGGTWDEDTWQIGYAADWTPAEPAESTYRVQAVLRGTGDPLLGSAVVTAQDADGAALFTVTVCWQEVANGA